MSGAEGLASERTRQRRLERPDGRSHVVGPLGGIAARTLVALLLSHRAFAQAPPSPQALPPGPWTATAGAGLALTSGNSDTLTFNVTFDATHDARTRNVLKGTGLYLRGQQNDALVANRLSLAFRDQYTLTDRNFVFGQLDYLRDTFKRIDYLVSPSMGVGFKFLDTAATKFSVDSGVGAVWEKNPQTGVRTSLGFNASEKFQRALTSVATFRHSSTALVKADNLSDGLYTFSVGLGTKLSEQLQLSIELLDTFKNRPPTSATKKNDVAVVTGVTARF